MRLDAETKEILHVWPLTTLRRWAPSPNSFTLDFGDYADQYYSVQTAEGDAISQLIGGYIDIILKKRKEQKRGTEENDEQVAVGEDVIRPAKAAGYNVVTSRAGQAMEMNVAGASMISEDGGRANAQQISKKQQVARGVEHGVLEHSVNPAQKLLIQSMANVIGAIRASQSELACPSDLPPMGSSYHTWISCSLMP